jgi:hypothetical protein
MPCRSASCDGEDSFTGLFGAREVVAAVELAGNREIGKQVAHALCIGNNLSFRIQYVHLFLNFDCGAEFG